MANKLLKGQSKKYATVGIIKNFLIIMFGVKLKH